MADPDALQSSTFRSGWSTTAPEEAGDVRIPAYQFDAEDRVGPAIWSLTPTEFDFGRRVDPFRTAIAPPDGETLVLTAPALGDDDRWWASRRWLRADTYAPTLARIDAAEEHDRAALKTHRMAEAQRRVNQSITVPESWRVLTTTGAEATVHPGIPYRVTGLSDGACGVMSTFGYVVMDPDTSQELVIPDEVLLGTNTEAEEEAKGHGSAVRLKADDIVAALKESSLRPWLAALSLADEHLHYVDADGMGMVFVLKGPAAPNDVPKRVRRDDPPAFDEGRGTPGLRIGSDIFIHTGHLGISAEHHEALHLASHPSFIEDFGWDFNEGATEYFTRLVARERNLLRSEDQYLSQYEAVNHLVDRRLISHGQLADAYFSGRTGALLAAFDAKRTGVSLEAYSRRAGVRYSFAARTVLDGALVPPAQHGTR